MPQLTAKLCKSDHRKYRITHIVFATILENETDKIYDWVEAKTRKSQASFQIIEVSSEPLPRMRLE